MERRLIGLLENIEGLFLYLAWIAFSFMDWVLWLVFDHKYEARL